MLLCRFGCPFGALCAGLQVLGQQRCRYEFFETRRTLKPDTGMHAHVSCQRHFLAKSLLANVASKWLFVLVDECVPLERDGSRERLVAKVAYEAGGLLLLVVLHMAFQRFAVDKLAAGRALHLVNLPIFCAVV